jgi:hypothetical protein
VTRPVRVVLVLVSLALLGGCASSPSPPGPTPAPAAAPAPAAPAAPAAAPAPARVTYREDKEFKGQVWMAEGFDSKGWDTLYIAPAAVEVPKLNPDGAENLEWAKGVLRDQLVAAIRATNVFPAVVTSEGEIKPGGKTLRLDNTIIEYEKGGGGARFFAGLYGAGQPVIKVLGRVAAEPNRPLFLFEVRRSGEGAGARWLGGYKSDKDIQQADIEDLAKRLAELMVRTSKK